MSNKRKKSGESDDDDFIMNEENIQPKKSKKGLNTSRITLDLSKNFMNNDGKDNFENFIDIKNSNNYGFEKFKKKVMEFEDDKDKEIKKLKEEINRLRDENFNQKDENKKLRDELNYKNEEIKKLNKRIRFLEDMADYQENEILNKIKNEKINKEKEKYNLPQNNINNNINSNPNNININNFNINRNNNNNINFNSNNNKIEIKPIKNTILPIQKYLRPPLIGLQNVGATCFMNATLQCLSQTTKLTNYFLKEENKNNIINNNISKLNPNEYQLAPVYHELIQNLWKINSKYKYYAPYNFMNRVNAMNSLFKKGEAGDSKDFIIFVLQQMHKELKKALNIRNINKVNSVNQYDKYITLMNFFNEFTKETSVISDLFFGFNETTNVCLNCKKYYTSRNETFPICYNYGIFNLLIFPLEEVRIMKDNNNMKNIFNFFCGPSNVVNLDDCFLYNQKTDLFTGENKIYCNICKQMSDSEYTSKIYISPNILILILNRGKGNKFKIKLDFGMKLDITNYVLQKEKPKIVYSLYGVITHLGQSGPYAHFVASCKSPVDNQWYRYNDAIVEPIKNFKDDVYNYGVPYILFYEKDN